ncbi:TPA: MFS transporter [Candidatus Sumerlaeota bacterium]|jgi:MFS family permease|nr:MFS transporter [Candidatus Sumerlaeota bacterium]
MRDETPSRTQDNVSGGKNLGHAAKVSSLRPHPSSLFFFIPDFRALRHRNYRLFFIGQGISLIGTWMQNIAMGWLVYRLTHSEALLGVVAFAGQIPAFFLTPLAGVWLDRVNRRKVITATQILSLTQATALAILVLTNHVAVWQIIILSVCLGIANAFDMPGRQSFVSEMVPDKADLGNAIALNSMLFNGARLVGPAIAGIMIATVGEGLCFLFNALSYIPVIISLQMMRVPPAARKAPKAVWWREMHEAFRYVADYPRMRSLIILLALVSFLGTPYSVLLPVVAQDFLHGGPQTFGFLVSSVAVGALLGAFFMTSRKGLGGFDRLRTSGVMMVGGTLAVFAFSRWLPLSMFLLVGTGFGIMVQMASANTTLQTTVDESKRGRVMSFYVWASMGMMPLGNLMAGHLASWFSATAAFCTLGLATLACGIIFHRALSKTHAQKI